MNTTCRPNLAESLLAQFCEAAEYPVWIVNVDDGVIVTGNAEACALFGVGGPEDLARIDPKTIMPDTIKGNSEARADAHDQLPREGVFGFEFGEGKTRRRLETVVRPCMLDDGARGLLCSQKTHHDALRRAGDFKIDALAHSPVMTTAYNADGDLIYANPAAMDAQRPEHTMVHERFVDPTEFETLYYETRQLGQCRRILKVDTRSGKRWHDVVARAFQDEENGEQTVLISETDVTDIKNAEQRSIHIANHDTLTGLPNRNMIRQEAPRLIAKAKADGEVLTFLIMDLDRFKDVNDTLGHAAGDDLLILVAEKLQTVMDGNGLVARLGGDEFLIACPGLADFEELDDYCRRIFEAFEDPFVLRNHRFAVTPSIGVSQFPIDGSDTSTLLKCADLALYEAKSAGRNTYSRFSVSLRTRIEKRVSLEQELREAVVRNEMEVHYQPRLSVETLEIDGAEALVRWRHPEHGLLSPGEFVEVAEDTGLIDEIGAWVAVEVGREQARLAEAGHDVCLSLNLSPRQFETDLLDRTLLNLAAETGCDPRRIELEITESMLIGDNDVVLRTLNRFKAAGYRVAIDDFGTGYSNLSYIQRYPINSLKIDKSFIDGGEHSEGIVKLIIALCDTLGVKAVAEGVETEEQLYWLRKLRCAEFQGYLFSRPVPSADFWRLLSEQDEPALPKIA